MCARNGVNPLRYSSRTCTNRVSAVRPVLTRTLNSLVADQAAQVHTYQLGILRSILSLPPSGRQAHASPSTVAREVLLAPDQGVSDGRLRVPAQRTGEAHFRGARWPGGVTSHRKPHP